MQFTLCLILLNPHSSHIQVTWLASDTEQWQCSHNFIHITDCCIWNKPLQYSELQQHLHMNNVTEWTSTRHISQVKMQIISSAKKTLSLFAIPFVFRSTFITGWSSRPSVDVHVMTHMTLCSTHYVYWATSVAGNSSNVEGADKW
jgi:hypothetical protein